MASCQILLRGLQGESYEANDLTGKKLLKWPRPKTLLVSRRRVACIWPFQAVFDCVFLLDRLTANFKGLLMMNAITLEKLLTQ